MSGEHSYEYAVVYGTARPGEPVREPQATGEKRKVRTSEETADIAVAPVGVTPTSYRTEPVLEARDNMLNYTITQIVDPQVAPAAVVRRYLHSDITTIERMGWELRNWKPPLGSRTREIVDHTFVDLVAQSLMLWRTLMLEETGGVLIPTREQRNIVKEHREHYMTILSYLAPGLMKYWDARRETFHTMRC